MFQRDEYICYGTKDEIETYQRILDFGDDDYGSFYYNLCPAYQTIVNSVVQSLTEGNEFLGYNLERILKAYKNIDSSISQYLLSCKLLEDAEKYLSKTELDIFQNANISAKTINNRIDAIKTRETIQIETVAPFYIQTICDYLLIDKALIEKGIGTFTVLKDEWYKIYMTDQKFQEITKKENNDLWNTKLSLQRYEQYLRDQRKLNENETIFENYTAVISYSGAYLLLKHQKGRAKELKAIQTLVHHLYHYQMFGGSSPFPIQSD